MSIDRFSRKRVLGGGAAALITPLLHARSMTRQARLTGLLAEGTDRVAGTPDEASYSSPGGLQSPYDNFITVAKDGGDYTSIRDAIDACHDPSVENTYCVFIYPGVYDEQVEMVDYVSLVGLDRDVCIVKSSDYDNLVIMANWSGLNELSVVNYYSGRSAAVYVAGVNNWFIDTCYIESGMGDVGNRAMALYIAGDATFFRILDTYFKAWNSANGGPCTVIRIDPNGFVWGFIDDCLIELPMSTSLGEGIYAQGAGLLDDITLQILHSIVLVDNGVQRQDGIVADGSKVYLEVEHTSIDHESSNGGGYDLYAVSNSTIIVRSDRYSTWLIDQGGLILPFMGDRPVRTCLNDTTDYTIEEAAGVYVNDPTGVMTISVPCRSDLSVVVAISWVSDTVGARSFSARVLVDGVLATAMAYAGEPAVNVYQNYAMIACDANLDAGNHTIQLQVRRFAVGDVVVVDQRQIVATTFPYP